MLRKKYPETKNKMADLKLIKSAILSVSLIFQD